MTWVSPNMPATMITSPTGTMRPTGSRSLSVPAIGMVSIAPMPCGATSKPAMRADSPRICWKYVGTSSSPPKKAATNRNIVMIETVSSRFLNSRRSISGCSGRNEWKTKAITRATPTIAVSHTRV